MVQGPEQLLKVGVVNKRGEHKPRIYSNCGQHPASSGKGKTVCYMQLTYTVTPESSDLLTDRQTNRWFTPCACTRVNYLNFNHYLWRQWQTPTTVTNYRNPRAHAGWALMKTNTSVRMHSQVSATTTSYMWLKEISLLVLSCSIDLSSVLLPRPFRHSGPYFMW